MRAYFEAREAPARLNRCRQPVSIAPMAERPPLILRREPPLAWLVVNRPEARNALNAAVWRDLASSVRTVAADGDVRVIILRGAGDQAFLSGADISEFGALRANAAMTAEYDALSTEAWQALGAAPQPVLAMINGLCFGGGVAVALACDLRFAATHARFAVPAARLGLSYPFAHGVERLVRVVGPTAAADILLSARVIDAAEALRIGLVNRSSPVPSWRKPPGRMPRRWRRERR